MLALMHHFDEPVTSGGVTYLARVYAGVSADDRWGGWLIFVPVGGGPAVATDMQTTRDSMPELSTWAGTLTHADLHVALERALTLNPDAELARELERLQQLEREEAFAEARADDLEAAAAAARSTSTRLENERDREEERVLEIAAETVKRESRRK